MRKNRVIPCVVASLLTLTAPARHTSGGEANFDGKWTGRSDAGQNCAIVDFTIAIKNNSISRWAITEDRRGEQARWEVSGSIDPGNKVSLITETTDQKVRRPRAKWTGEITETGISLAQPSTDSCQRKAALTRR